MPKSLEARVEDLERQAGVGDELCFMELLNAFEPGGPPVIVAANAATHIAIVAAVEALAAGQDVSHLDPLLQQVARQDEAYSGCWLMERARTRAEAEPTHDVAPGTTQRTPDVPQHPPVAPNTERPAPRLADGEGPGSPPAPAPPVPAAAWFDPRILELRALEGLPPGSLRAAAIDQWRRRNGLAPVDGG